MKKHQWILLVIMLLFLCCISRDVQATDEVPTDQDGGSVVLITIDALRADALGCYGHPRSRTPMLDYLSRRGTVFIDAIAASSWTLASVPSMMTSRNPCDHGLRYWGMSIGSGVETLAEYLRNHGVESSFAGKLIPVLGGLERGFGHFESIRTDAAETMVSDAGKTQLKQNALNRFFLWLHYLAPHAPYEPPEPFADTVSDVSTGKKVEAYFGEATWSDHLLHRLLNSREFREWSERQPVQLIISADHGEVLLERKDMRFDHGLRLTDELVRVPLIVVSNRETSNRQTPTSRIVGQQVQHLDLAPTICSFLGIPVSASFRGRTLQPVFDGVSIESMPAISSVIDDRLKGAHSERYAIRTPDMKIVCRRPERTCVMFDLTTDPREKNPLPLENTPQIISLHNELKRYLNICTSPEIPENPVADDAYRERLKSLGYLD